MNLAQAVEQAFRITPRQKSALARIGVRTVRDVLFHFPSRYESLGGAKQIRDLAEGEKASVIAEVVGLKAEKTWKKRLRIAEGVVRDASGILGVVWFNQPYLANVLKPGMRARFSGKVSRHKGGFVIANPSFESVGEDDLASITGDSLLPIYPESYGITSRWFRYQIRRLLPALGSLPDPLPPEILVKYHLPSLGRAIHAIHAPKTLGEAEASRKRFSFEEIFYIQLNRQRERKRLDQEPAFSIPTDAGLMARFAVSLPFPLTGAQERVIRQILDDFGESHPMARLLEGDVGSGKTIVAAAAALNAVRHGYQVAYMAPTEILARQHFDEFIKRLAPFKIRIGLLTGSEGRKFPSKVNPTAATRIARSQLLRWCRSGDVQILIGTHALIEDRVKFAKLGFVVVDEQHRFGVRQRAQLVAKRKAQSANRSDLRFAMSVTPHFLSMTATPIPRTLALTMYGDLDLSVLDEMPPGREPVETRVIGPGERAATYAFIHEEVRRGGQVFVICPRIEAKREAQSASRDDARFAISALQQHRFSDWDDVKSVKAEYKKLSEEIFPDLRVGMVHGKLLPKEKERVMKKFKQHELDILVSTSVVEVGVDVPNASIMMIEGGERFGLAQLHQFRGRVGRGPRKSYCLVFTTDGGETRRLKALKETKTGFELAEYDLAFRGPGALSGEKQWGLSDVGMEALKNIRMVEAARNEAQALAAKDPELSQYPLLRERVAAVNAEYHFE